MQDETGIVKKAEEYIYNNPGDVITENNEGLREKKRTGNVKTNT